MDIPVRVCHWCGQAYQPWQRRQTHCCKRCRDLGDREFKRQAVIHYRAWLKAQANGTAFNPSSPAQIVEQPMVETVKAAKAIPVGWDRGKMRNWGGKVEPKSTAPASVVVEQRIKR